MNLWNTAKQTPQNVTNVQDALGQIPGVPASASHPISSFLQAAPAFVGNQVKSSIPTRIPSADEINTNAQSRNSKLMDLFRKFLN